MGRPVIGSNHGGLLELVGDDERGLLFTPGDAADLARKVTALAADSGRARAMGENGVRFVRQQFDPAKHYDGLMKLYGRVLDQGVGCAA